MDGPDRIDRVSPAPPPWRVGERERRPREEDAKHRPPQREQTGEDDDPSGPGRLIDVRA